MYEKSEKTIINTLFSSILQERISGLNITRARCSLPRAPTEAAIVLKRLTHAFRHLYNRGSAANAAIEGLVREIDGQEGAQVGRQGLIAAAGHNLDAAGGCFLVEPLDGALHPLQARKTLINIGQETIHGCIPALPVHDDGFNRRSTLDERLLEHLQ